MKAALQHMPSNAAQITPRNRLNHNANSWSFAVSLPQTNATDPNSAGYLMAKKEWMLCVKASTSHLRLWLELVQEKTVSKARSTLAGSRQVVDQRPIYSGKHISEVVTEEH